MKLKIVIAFLLISNINFGQVVSTINSKEEFYTELSYEWVNEKIIVPVVINNTTYRFILDTGAPTLISSKLSKDFSSAHVKTIAVSDASNKKSTLDLITVPEITLGGVAFKNTPALINKDDSNLLFRCFNIDGLIGSNLLRNSIVQILPEQQKIILTNIKKRLKLSKKNATKLALIGEQSTPSIQIKIKGNRKANEHLILDTGMKGFYALSNRNLSIFQKDNIFNITNESSGSVGTGLFGAEEKTKYYRLTIPELSINKARFQNITVETTNGSNSRIGSEILKYGAITIDFINKKFYFNPTNLVNNLSEKSLGFTPTMIDDKLVVGLVWDDALKKQMYFGDQLLEVNGIDMVNYNYCDLVAQESIFSKSDQLALKLKNSDDAIKELIVKKQ